MRTFIAVHTPDAIRGEMKKAQDELRRSGADVRWEHYTKFHITLKFLGETDESSLPAITEAIRRVIAPFRPFSISYEGLGCFPTLRRPRIVWIGCKDGGNILTAIKNAVDGALEPMGFEIEDRSFHPHVTIGRVKSQNGVDHLISKLEKCTFEQQPATVEEIFLMQSVLKPHGSEYSIIERFPLSNS